MRDNLVGKEVALLLMGQGPEGEDDWSVFRTTVGQRDGQLFLRYEMGTLELSDDWASRVRPVADDTRGILLGADYFLPLTVGNVSQEEAAAMERTGLKWPTSMGPTEGPSKGAKV